MIDLSAVGFRIERRVFPYDWKTLALYALGIGAGAEDLDHLYEKHGPKAYPTFAVVPAFEAVVDCIRACKVPFESVLHGAQSERVGVPALRAAGGAGDHR